MCDTSIPVPLYSFPKVPIMLQQYRDGLNTFEIYHPKNSYTICISTNIFEKKNLRTPLIIPSHIQHPLEHFRFWIRSLGDAVLESVKRRKSSEPRVNPLRSSGFLFWYTPSKYTSSLFRVCSEYAPIYGEGARVYSEYIVSNP